MKLDFRRPSKPTLFAILMVGAAIVSLLPAGWTGCAGGVTQPISPLAWALRTATRQFRQTTENLSSAEPTREDLERLRRENQRLILQIGQQQVIIAEMDRMVSDLTGLRDQLGDLDAKIIFASIVRSDSSPQRQMITISKGRQHGIRPGDWVAAGVASGERDLRATGRDLLLQQWLIGRVSAVKPYTSDVQLTTDSTFGPHRVRLAKALPDGRWELAERGEALTGQAQGVMRIAQASKDHWQAGFEVVLLPLDPSRPMALAVGRITGSEVLDTGLHFDFEVEPWGDVSALSHVYVISLSR